MNTIVIPIWSNDKNIAASLFLSNRHGDYCYRDFVMKIPDFLMKYAEVDQGKYFHLWFETTLNGHIEYLHNQYNLETQKERSK